jgi:FMN phosphatase YigB (HAD superfamily)
VTAFVFDMGWTLFDETRQLEELRSRDRAAQFTADDLYPDALPCLAALRERGHTVGVAGNAAGANEAVLADRVDFVGSSERWGVSKPSPAFFARVCAEAGCDAPGVTYVGDRVDNDVLPALAFGMQAVHLRRGPWGRLHDTPGDVRCIDSLSELL